MIQSDGRVIEAVVCGQQSLDLVGAHHRGIDVRQQQRGRAAALPLSADMIACRENGSEIVGGVTTDERRIAEVEPTDHDADVVGRLDGVDDMIGAPDGNAVDRGCTGYPCAKPTRAFRIPQGRDRAADGVG